jgi:hypothetical protein
MLPLFLPSFIYFRLDNFNFVLFFLPHGFPTCGAFLRQKGTLIIDSGERDLHLRAVWDSNVSLLRPGNKQAIFTSIYNCAFKDLIEFKASQKTTEYQEPP